jgi:hypothetical protein
MYHHVPADRMTVDSLCRRMVNEEISDVYTMYHGGIPGRARLLKHAAAIAVRNVGAWAKALLRRGHTDKPSVRLQMDAARTQ